MQIVTKFTRADLPFSQQDSCLANNSFSPDSRAESGDLYSDRCHLPNNDYKICTQGSARLFLVDLRQKFHVLGKWPV
jgi:hypothetical protein